MNIVPFELSHLAQINLQERQRRSISHLTIGYFQSLTEAGSSLSAEVDGRIIASAGLAVGFAGMGILWSAVGRGAGPHFVPLHRAARRLIEIQNMRRIEAAIECDFTNGSRWLEMLGFQREGRMTAYGLDGEDFYLYALTAKRGLLN